MTWLWKYFLSELKRSISYRVEFWIGLFGNIGSQFAVAFFLWRSIYAERGATLLEGFSFGTLMAYYLLAPLVERVIHGSDFGTISRDIYDGGLNKYLVYPVSFFGAKFMTHLAHTAFAAIQLGILWLLLLGPLPHLFGSSASTVVDLPRMICAAILIGLSILVQFFMTACLEQVAFWADNVWSLNIMMRMIMGLTGGALLPLAFFPEAVAQGFRYLPFHCFIDLPVRLLLGQAKVNEALSGMGVAVIWALFLSAVANLLWRRGLLRYSGAGM